MIKLLRSSEIQVSELGNYEIPYFPYRNNNSEISEPKFRCCYFGKENDQNHRLSVWEVVSPSSDGLFRQKVAENDRKDYTLKMYTPRASNCV